MKVLAGDFEASSVNGAIPRAGQMSVVRGESQWKGEPIRNIAEGPESET